MTALQISAYRDGSFRGQDELRAQLLDVLADAYEDPDSYLDGELETCDTLLLARDGEGRAAAFLLLAFGELSMVDGARVRTLYAGPGVERDDLRGSGAALQLPLYVMQHLLDPGVGPYLFWSDTMTGAGYLATARTLPGLEPGRDGTCSPDSMPLAIAIREQLVESRAGEDHPFVLRRLYSDTRLRAEERARDQAIIAAHGLSLFDELGVDRDAGDAVLILGWISGIPER